MSFGINGPSPKFGIQEAQNMRNNGGGGNLGYFQGGKKKKNKDNEEDIFETHFEDDEFIPEGFIEEEKKSESIVEKTKDFIKKFKKPKHS